MFLMRDEFHKFDKNIISISLHENNSTALLGKQPFVFEMHEAGESEASVYCAIFMFRRDL